MAWLREPEVGDALMWRPVEVLGENLSDRIGVVSDPRTGKTHLTLAGKYGDTITVTLRPSDARRLGVALIEAGTLATMIEDRTPTGAEPAP